MPTSKDFAYMRGLRSVFRMSRIAVNYENAMLENNAFSDALRYKSYPTLPCVTSLLDSFCLGTFRYGFIMLPPCVFARLLVGNYKGNFCRNTFFAEGI